MNTAWHIQDIIDLEYFLHLDSGRTSAAELQEIRERDRLIGREAAASAAGSGREADRHLLLRAWLDARTRQEKACGNAFLPGRLTAEIYARFCLLFPALGILTGGGAALSFFTYTGIRPLNVFHFLAAFVFLQLAILAVLAGSLLFRALRPVPSPSLLSSLTGGLLVRLFRIAAGRLLAGMPAEKRYASLAVLGVIRSKQHYGRLLFWPLFVLLQLFAVGFNAGILTVTLFRVAVSDIAFGWQSTLQLSAEAVSHFIRILAFPWSGLVGAAAAYPSLQEIEGSRIILKDGIYHLATGNLVSWWPFLCCALIAYGLLPRLALLVLGLLRQRSCRAALRFDQAVFDRLVSRMRTPLVSTQAVPAEANSDGRQPPAGLRDMPGPDSRLTGVRVLVPDELFDRCSEPELVRTLADCGHFPMERIRFGLSFEADLDILQKLAGNDTPVLILVEAWMPPITDFLAYVGDLRKALPAAVTIVIGLLGRPAATIFTRAAAQDVKIWQQKTVALGDPHLAVEMLVKSSSAPDSHDP